MQRLLLVHGGHPGGRTATLVARAVAAVAEATDAITLCVRPALEADAADLRSADGVLLATPEHFGYMSGALKDFFDRTFYPVEGQTTGRPYALIVSAGTDGTGTCRAVERIARGYGWREVAAPLIVLGEPDAAALERVAELAATLAVGLAEGVF